MVGKGFTAVNQFSKGSLLAERVRNQRSRENFGFPVSRACVLAWVCLQMPSAGYLCGHKDLFIRVRLCHPRDISAGTVPSLGSCLDNSGLPLPADLSYIQFYSHVAFGHLFRMGLRLAEVMF